MAGLEQAQLPHTPAALAAPSALTQQYRHRLYVPPHVRRAAAANPTFHSPFPPPISTRPRRPPVMTPCTIVQNHPRVEEQHASQAVDPLVEFDLLIPESKVGLVIGRQRTALNSVEELSGARCSVVTLIASRGKTKGSLTIEGKAFRAMGTLEQASEAVLLVAQRLHDARMRERGSAAAVENAQASFALL